MEVRGHINERNAKSFIKHLKYIAKIVAIVMVDQTHFIYKHTNTRLIDILLKQEIKKNYKTVTSAFIWQRYVSKY